MSHRRNDDVRTSFRKRDNSRNSARCAGIGDQLQLFELYWENRSEMKATIHHNPLCGTSRKTLQILEESGAEVTVNEYLKTPPSRDELERLYRRAGIRPREGLRAKEPLAAELGLTREDVTDDEVLDAMVSHPILINRPLVETDKGVRLCRPQEVVREIL